MLQHSTPALMVRRSAILAAAFLPPRLAQNSVDEHPQGSGAVLGPPDDYNGCSLQAICGAPAQRGPRLLPIVVPGPVILKIIVLLALSRLFSRTRLCQLLG